MLLQQAERVLHHRQDMQLRRPTQVQQPQLLHLLMRVLPLLLHQRGLRGQQQTRVRQLRPLRRQMQDHPPMLLLPVIQEQRPRLPMQLPLAKQEQLMDGLGRQQLLPF